MAASLRRMCSCSTVLLMRTCNNSKVNAGIHENAQTPFVFRSSLNCSKSAHVIQAEEKCFVTSTCHGGLQTMKRWLRNGNVSSGFSIQPVKPLFPSTWPKRHRQYPPHKLFCRTIFQCQTLHASNIQTESKSSRSHSAAHDHVNRHDYDGSENKISSQAHFKHKAERYSDCKAEKKEDIRTIPNLLTTLRMGSSPLLGYLVVCEQFGWALGFFTLAGISDLLDGYIARNFDNQKSALGSAIDPLADKLLVTILTISLASVGLIPLPLTILIVLRDLCLISGGLYIRYTSLPPPITLSRYFDLSLATLSVTPTLVSKVNTGLQLSLVALSLGAPFFGYVDHVALQTLWWATGTTTVLSGAHYMFSWKKYITLLNKDQKES